MTNVDEKTIEFRKKDSKNKLCTPIHIDYGEYEWKLEVYSTFSNTQNNRVGHSTYTYAWWANHDLINNFMINKTFGDDKEDRDSGGRTV